MFTRPDILGTFILAKQCHRKWLVGLRLDPCRGLTEEIFTDEYCIEYVKKVINDPAIEVRLINKAFWTMAALIADKYRVGRVFFAGDAAHRLPPTGGFGMNTGIQDSHNLAWKLVMVIKGLADDTLLDSYFKERVQIAKTNTAWSISNAKRFETIFTALAHNDLKTFKEALQDQSRHINNILLDLGFVYGSDYHTLEEYTPSAKVGARALHCWLRKGDDRLSTLDLFRDEFVLLCHPDADVWQEIYQKFPCKIATVGDLGDYQDIHRDFLEIYNISKSGAVLVRPDGHVAWRQYDETGQAADFPWLLGKSS